VRWWQRLRGILPRMWAGADYEAAAATRRTTGWTPATSDINTLVFRNSDTLRSRSRDMVRRNPWAANALDAFIGNAIGTGIKPQSLHPDASVKEQIQSLWFRWTDEAEEGLKSIRVRFPSDDEWIAQQRRRKVTIKQLGRGVSETIIGNAEDADAALLGKIREGDGPEVDPFEASRIFEQLSHPLPQAQSENVHLQREERLLPHARPARAR
jgi:hypothetical protein